MPNIRRSHTAPLLKPADDLGHLAKGARSLVILAWFVLIGLLRDQLARPRPETLTDFLTFTLIPALTLACVSIRLRETRVYAPMRALADMRAMLRSRPAAQRVMEYAAQLHLVYQALAAQVTSAISPLVNALDRRLWALGALLREILPACRFALPRAAFQPAHGGDETRRGFDPSTNLFNLLC